MPTLMRVSRGTGFRPMQQDVFRSFAELPRGIKRTIIATLLIIDATVLGLLNQQGILNQVDKLFSDSLPDDLVWLLQIIQSLCAGFFYVKILFDDLNPGKYRTIAIFLSPLFLIILTFITIDFLLSGLEKGASVTLDPVALGTNTLIWSSTYLSIAIGLTLTYKVQRYGNFAQSEFFMIGMFMGMIFAWSEHYFPLFEAPSDGVIVWSLLFRAILAGLVVTGLVGVLIDRLVYKGFRIRRANPQVMMIASLGVALILRSIYYMRFGASKIVFSADADLRASGNRWEIPTTKLRLNLGDNSLRMAEPFVDANGDGVWQDTESFTDIDGDGRYDTAQIYRHFNCEQTGIDETTGEPILSRMVSEGTKPSYEVYNIATDCVSEVTTNYPYYKGIVPAVVFISIALLLLLINKTRLGRKMRAVADNPDLAASSGINVERIQITSAFLSAGITGLGGAIFAVTLLFNPTTAFTLLLPSFAVIVLGSIGSLSGAIVACVLIAFVRSLSSPILIGVGFRLSRSNYATLEGVMPYIFLVAILLIIPSGLGDYWEKWKIDRIRNKDENKSQPSKKSVAALAFLPTGIFGLHHWRSGRSDKAQNFSMAVIGAYFIHKFFAFIGKNSLSDGSCNEVCEEYGDQLGTSTNLALITDRNDGTLTIEDSPFSAADVGSPPEELTIPVSEWTQNSLTEINQKWLDLMQTEISFVNLISDFGDLIWPLIPLLLWILAITEGVNILSDGKINDFRQKSVIRLSPLYDHLNEIKNRLNSKLNIFISSINTTLSKLNNFHLKMVNIIKETIKKIQLDATFKSTKSSNIFNSENKFLKFGQYGREGRQGSWATFLFLMSILIILIWWLPISNSDTYNWSKTFQVSNVVVSLSIFILMAFSLNLHTGYTGMVNFGVIFFVGIGAITVALLTAPEEMHGYGWDILPAAIVAIMISAIFGWALAYPTARLRTDYFAIVTISLGEILRVLLSGEPLLRTGPILSSIGLGNYPLPLKEWWFCGPGVRTGADTDFVNPESCRYAVPELSTPSSTISEIMNLGDPAPYSLFLAFLGVIMVLIVWLLLEALISSPWGRILKSIREDEDVSQHHGHDVLTQKASSLALGAAIAALAGVLWAWKLTGFGPTFMAPAKSTFLVWAAFIIGGAANNKGMIIGASIIVLMEFVFNVLVAASTPDLPLYNTAQHIDSAFLWLVTEQWEVTTLFLIILLFGLLLRFRTISELGFWGALTFSFTAIMMDGERSLDSATNIFGIVSISGANMAYFKLLLIGALMLFSLKFNAKGLLPEVPNRPERPNMEK